MRREIDRLQTREAELVSELDAIRAAHEELVAGLAALDRFADEEAQPSTRPLLRAVPDEPFASELAGKQVLRGAQIRETAVRMLAAMLPVDDAVHYRTWFDLLTSQGFVPAGKDPLATFLTQISRSPVVRRTTSPGIYELNRGFPDVARRRLEQLRAHLAEAEEPPAEAGIPELAGARERRSALRAEIEATERALEEAVRSLAAANHGDAA